ncbi:serine hydrolase [Lactiplantibacillus pentosus]|uniref:serine hydrolase n=1 Tax=Lactiplantibacillus pentosus TaxID=1589 RepID=UPI003D2EF008
MKICPNCHHQNANDVNFCENCGTKLAEAPKQCPRCQSLNPTQNRFCENCGYDFSAGTASNHEQPVNKASAQPLENAQPGEQVVQTGQVRSQPENQSQQSTASQLKKQTYPTVAPESASQSQQTATSQPENQSQQSTASQSESQSPQTPTSQPVGQEQSLTPHSATSTPLVDRQQQSTAASSASTIPKSTGAQLAGQSGQMDPVSASSSIQRTADARGTADAAQSDGSARVENQAESVANQATVANATQSQVSERPVTRQTQSERQSYQGEQEETSNDASDQSTVTSNPATRTNQAVAHKSKVPWLIALLVLIVAVGGAAYFLYLRPSTARSTAPAQSSVAHKKTTRHSSSVTKNSQSTTKSTAVSFDQSQIRNDISSTVGAISGTNSVYVSPVNSKQTVLVNDGSQRSASSIKIFIMVTAYAMAKEGVFNLTDTHTVTDSEKVGGTGVIQNMDAGTKLSYQEIIEHMIDDSDNTAANIMIEKLGGFDLINNKISNMGATDTKLRRKMMDTKALDDGKDNTTSAHDMGMTLKKIYNHQLVSRQADEAMLTILAKNQNRTKLPKDLPSSATVYNKTGEYADYGVQNDAEIVKNSHGAFVAVVLSEDGDQNDQIDAMNRLGSLLYQNILE